MKNIPIFGLPGRDNVLVVSRLAFSSHAPTGIMAIKKLRTIWLLWWVVTKIMCYHCKVYLHLELSSLNRLPNPSCLIVMHKCEGPFCLFKEEIGECVHVRERGLICKWKEIKNDLFLLNLDSTLTPLFYNNSVVQRSVECCWHKFLIHRRWTL